MHINSPTKHYVCETKLFYRKSHKNVKYCIIQVNEMLGELANRNGNSALI